MGINGSTLRQLRHFEKQRVLKRNRGFLARIARQIHRHPNTVGDVWRGRSTSAVVEAAINEALQGVDWSKDAE